MPEIKNTFTSGKMNKDLDERIVPKNEYRDALNIDVATTEGSDIGSAQNSYGNLKVSALGVVGAKCIGSALNPENQKVIWFVSGTSIDLIAEFNQAADSIVPILVDNHGGSDSFLNCSIFSKELGKKILSSTACGMYFLITSGAASATMLSVTFEIVATASFEI